MLRLLIDHMLDDDSGAARMEKFKKFICDSRGLVTIEWVAIAAVALVAAVTIAVLVFQGAGTLGDAVADEMTEAAGEVSGG